MRNWSQVLDLTVPLAGTGSASPDTPSFQAALSSLEGKPQAAALEPSLVQFNQ